MSRFGVTRKGYWMAALMAVMIVGTGCDSPTKPKPVPVAPVVSIVSHQNGEFVNDSSPINTPVVLTGSATHKGSAISGSWKVNGVVHQGNSVSVVLNVGANTACFSASADGENREKCITLHVHSDLETLDVQIVQPTAGAKVFAGDPIPCELTSKDPRKLIENVTWTLDGEAMSCGPNKVLHVGTASISSTGTSTANPGVGNHDLKVTANARGNLKVEDEVKFEVRTRPVRLVLTTQVGTSYDFWLENSDGTNRRQLTTDGTAKVSPALSPDSSKIVYRSRAANGNIAIFVSNADGSNPVNVSGENRESGESPRDPVFSPDGTLVLYIGTRESKHNPTFTAYLVNTDGSGRRSIPTPACDPTRDPLPCYLQITPQALFDPQNPSRILVKLEEFRTGSNSAFGVLGAIDINTGAVTRLADISVSTWGIEDVSPDGAWVVVRTDDDSGTFLSISTDGSGVTKLWTPTGNGGFHPWYCSGSDYLCYIPSDKPTSMRQIGPDKRDIEISDFPDVHSTGYPRRHPFY